MIEWLDKGGHVDSRDGESPGTLLMAASVHAYMRTCIHAYAYMRTCVHAYMRTCVHAYMHTCLHACILTYRRVAGHFADGGKRWWARGSGRQAASARCVCYLVHVHAHVHMHAHEALVDRLPRRGASILRCGAST